MRTRRLAAVFAGALAIACVSPAQAADPGANVVSGTVLLRDRNGQEIRDRSNLVVFIDGAPASAPPAARTTISHKGRRYTPSILPVVRGQQVDFLNDDGIFHNVFSLSKPKPFDLGIYPQGATRSVRFDQPGLVKIYCNIHPDMVGNILVLTNAHYARTDAQGRFEIRDIPDGEFTLRVWHESTAEVARPIALSGGERLVEDMELTAKKRIVSHNNKFGKPYDTKY
jgi:plastocyanin